jgi:hypothetical protein
MVFAVLKFEADCTIGCRLSSANLQGRPVCSEAIYYFCLSRRVFSKLGWISLSGGKDSQSRRLPRPRRTNRRESEGVETNAENNSYGN